MTGWTVMLRGVRFRAGRSLLVLSLAVTSTAAAVVATGYLRAAQQSVLTDGLRSAPAYATSIVVAASGSDGSGAPSIDDAHLAVNHAFGQEPALAAHFGHPIAAEDTDTAMTNVSGGLAMARLAYRENVCAHLRIVGDCPSSGGEVLVSARSATANQIRTGDHLVVRYGVDAANGPSLVDRAHDRTVTVVGLYTPIDPAEAYWGSNAYFANGFDPTGLVPRRMDAVFTPDEQDVRADPGAPVALRLEIPLRTDSVGVDQVAGLRHDLASFALASNAANLTMSSGLPQVLDTAAAAARALDRTVPVVAVPLVLLCLFVLFLVVAALAEERGPEIALAKLRGFPAGRAARFGVAEMLMLIVLAAPIGAVLGLVLVEVAARALLAGGTHAEVRWPVLAAAALAMAAGAGAAWLAARSTLRRPVLALLRRVPERTGWRAGAGEILAVVLAAASLTAAAQNRRSPLAYLAAPLIALVAGIVAARLLGAFAKLRLRISSRRGRIVGVLAGARLSRQPGRHRVIVVVTVAVALLVFASTAWDVGARARTDSADDALGAQRVYSVVAPYPTALIDAVHRADPSGNSMAVVRGAQRYAGADIDLIGVESSALPKVAIWRGESTGQLTALAGRLRPAVAPELTVRGTITVTASVSVATPGAAEFGVLVSAAGQPPTSVPLGLLAVGTPTYTGRLVDCAAGCRLLGFTIGRSPGALGRTVARMDITAVRATGASVVDFADPTLWQVSADRAPDAHVTLTTGPSLGVAMSSTDSNDALIAYRDTPSTLAAVLAGAAPADDPGASTFDFPGFADDKEPFSVIGHATRLPRVGDRGLLFDLGDAVGMAERTGTLGDDALRYEVWANASAPADLPGRLAAQGVSVLRTQTVGGYLDQLSRGAPTLGLWLYLLAGALALLLAVGVVLLGAFIGAQTRVYEYAALKVTGVRPKVLRRAVVREYRSTLGVALIVGIAAGLGGAVLMLPSIPLVTVGAPTGDVPYGTRMLALPSAIVLSIVAMALVVVAALRMLRRATPERLREGA